MPSYKGMYFPRMGKLDDCLLVYAAESFAIETVGKFPHRDVQNKASSGGASENEPVFGFECDNVLNVYDNQLRSGSSHQTFQ